ERRRARGPKGSPPVREPRGKSRWRGRRRRAPPRARGQTPAKSGRAEQCSSAPTALGRPQLPVCSFLRSNLEQMQPDSRQRCSSVVSCGAVRPLTAVLLKAYLGRDEDANPAGGAQRGSENPFWKPKAVAPERAS